MIRLVKCCINYNTIETSRKHLPVPPLLGQIDKVFVLSRFCTNKVRFFADDLLPADIFKLLN
jgi:hypothetical protein